MKTTLRQRIFYKQNT